MVIQTDQARRGNYWGLEGEIAQARRRFAEAGSLVSGLVALASIYYSALGNAHSMWLESIVNFFIMPLRMWYCRREALQCVDEFLRRAKPATPEEADVVSRILLLRRSQKATDMARQIAYMFRWEEGLAPHTEAQLLLTIAECFERKWDVGQARSERRAAFRLLDRVKKESHPGQAMRLWRKKIAFQHAEGDHAREVRELAGAQMYGEKHGQADQLIKLKREAARRRCR